MLKTIHFLNLKTFVCSVLHGQGSSNNYLGMDCCYFLCGRHDWRVLCRPNCIQLWKVRREIIFNNLITYLRFFPFQILRKKGLLLTNILAAIGAVFLVGAKYAGSYEMLLAGRLVIGINSGINAGISPMYLTEICPTSLRGAVSFQ